jgi:rod shape determining protein RodA
VTTTTVPTRRGLVSGRRHPDSPYRHVDVVLAACTAAVAALGALMIYSATRGPQPPYHLAFIKKQVIFLGFGVLVLGALAALDYRRLRNHARAAYLAVTALLLGVLTPLGSRTKGTQGWFQLGSLQLQPSEPAKLGLIIGLAALGARCQGRIDLRRLTALLVVAALPIGLVLLQPDLGTALVSCVVTVAMLLLAGAKGRHLAAVGIVGIVLAGFVLHSDILQQYQKDRLTVFVSQDHRGVARDRGDAYSLDQAKIAIGSGGLAGQGLFRGTQTRLGNVPEQRTDFIFTAVAEELGFLGAATLLGLLAIIVWRTWRAARLAADEFGRLLCGGIMAMLVFQIFENVGMTMGIMPITGIPLPLMSYGGSSVLTVLAAIGLVQSVHMRR